MYQMNEFDRKDRGLAIVGSSMVKGKTESNPERNDK
jgi:hypothetical protein